MWSFGLILIELATGRACFRGTTEADQLALVFRALGRPTSAAWPGVERLDGYPRARVTKSPVAHPRFLQGIMNDAQLCGDEAAVALGALRYNPASRLCAHEAAALLGGMPPPNEPAAPDPPPGVRADQLADPGRGALADAICHATTAHRLDWDILRVAAWIADGFVTTPQGAAYLAAAAQVQIDLLAHPLPCPLLQKWTAATPSASWHTGTAAWSARCSVRSTFNSPPRRATLGRLPRWPRPPRLRRLREMSDWRPRAGGARRVSVLPQKCCTFSTHGAGP